MKEPDKIFNGTSKFYTSFRPSYPRGVIEVLRKEIGFSWEWSVADMGSGTGILSRLFLENGNIVKCVEPNDEMREMSVRNLKDLKGVQFIKGTGENSGLPDCSVDLVSCGQSFHWMDPQLAQQEFKRILREEKWVALIWNDRVMDPETFTGRYESVVRRYSREYHSSGSTVLDLEDFESFFKGNFKKFEFPNLQKMTLDAVIGRYRSASYAIDSSDPSYVNLTGDFSKIFKQFEVKGKVEMTYLTKLFLGNL